MKQQGVADDQLKNSLDALDEARNFAVKSVAPIALCVQRYVSHNGDDGEASDWIADVARWLRAIQEIQGKAPTLCENNLPHESWQAMWTITGQLGQKRQRASNSGDACAAVYDDIKHPISWTKGRGN